MKIEIKSVTRGVVDLIETKEPLPLYRRFINPDTEEITWEHHLGDLHGWHRYTVTEFLEEVYDEWTKKTSK